MCCQDYIWHCLKADLQWPEEGLVSIFELTLRYHSTVLLVFLFSVFGCFLVLDVNRKLLSSEQLKASLVPIFFLTQVHSIFSQATSVVCVLVSWKSFHIHGACPGRSFFSDTHMTLELFENALMMLLPVSS